MKDSVYITCPKCGYMVSGRLWRCPGCGGSDNNDESGNSGELPGSIGRMLIAFLRVRTKKV